MAVNRQWRLKARPVGRIKASDFELVEAPVPKAGPGQAVARLRFLSLDPTNRIWVTDAESYLPPVQIGEVMIFSTVSFPSGLPVATARRTISVSVMIPSICRPFFTKREPTRAWRIAFAALEIEVL